MTLILAMANPSCLIVMSDRRVSTETGGVFDEYNKMIYARTSDARMIVTFTGHALDNIADAGSVGPPAGAATDPFNATEWIAQTLYDAAEAGHTTVDSLLDRLAEAIPERLSSSFNDSVGITLCAAGFRNDPQSRAFLRVLTLDTAAPVPAVDTTDREPIDGGLPGWVHAFGQAGAVAAADLAYLRTMLDEQKDPEFIVQKALRSMHTATGRARPRYAVGKQVSSTVLARSNDGWPGFDYHSNKNVETIHLPIFLSLQGGDEGVQFIGNVRMDQAGRTLRRAKTPRNAPCGCGSGVKSKDCLCADIKSLPQRLYMNFRRADADGR